MNTSFITVVANIKARAGKETDTKAALMALIEPTRKENGCLKYDLHISASDASEFLFYEHWTSEDALVKHSQSEHIKGLKERSEELLARPTTVTIWRMIG